MDATACQQMQCIKSEPCGPFSVRGVGAAFSCGCIPGYYYDNSNQACQPCSASILQTYYSSYYFYCPGGELQPQACPEHSITISNVAAFKEECFCIPGFFHFAGVCMQCPTSLWCPWNGTTAPVPCIQGGITLSGGASSPLDCICPSRTYGLLCEPCDDSMDCSVPINPIPFFMAVRLGGWGGVWGVEAANACLQSAFGRSQFILYSTQGASSAGFLVDVSQSTNSLAWSWVAVVPVLTAMMSHIWTDNITACMSDSFVHFYFVVLDPSRPLLLKQGASCRGRHWEWNGLDGGASGCTCVAGYEEVPATAWGTQCFPCLNGTVRPRRSKNGCEPCEEGAGNSLAFLAPFLGMSSCICPEGMSLGLDGLCTGGGVLGERELSTFFVDGYVWVLPIIVFGLWAIVLCVLGVAFTW